MLQTHFTLEIQNGDLSVYRNGAVILRGRVDLRGGGPSVSQEAHGWRIEHPGQAQDIFHLRTSGHWFGGLELINQLWPLEKAMLDASPLITSDNGPQGLSGILTPLWLASSGAAILAEGDQELHISVNRSNTNQPTFAWSLDQPAPPHQRPPADDGTGDRLLQLSGPGLRYRLLVGDDAVEAWRACLRHLGHPPSVPPEALWRAPIWTTWARFKMFITQERIIEFADEIIAHGYPHGVMEVDDKWQTCYGDLVFDPARFPAPRAMIDALHQRGFAVTCWVMPFINPDAQNFTIARRRGYLQRQADGSPRSLRWWQGEGYLLDVANAEAMEWFAHNLRAMQAATGLDGFKFDAGEAIFAQELEGAEKPGSSSQLLPPKGGSLEMRLKVA